MLSRGLLPAAVLLTSVLLSGCAAPAASPAGPAAGPRPPLTDLRPPPDPRSFTGPATAALGQPDIVAPPAPVQHLPVTVTDHQGTRVTVTDTSRILAFDLAGTLAATVFGLGLGGRVVGRDVSTAFPSARNLPLVTHNGHQLNAEAILALRPTVVLTDTTIGPWDAVLQLRDAHVPVVVLDPKRTIDTVGRLVREVADALGAPAAGDQLANRLNGEITAKKAEIAKLVPADPARRLRIVFLYLRGQAGVYYLFGGGSGADSLIDALGGRDVATEAGVEGMRPVNPEALVKAGPDVILVMTKGLQSVGGVGGALRVPGVAQTPAGLHHRFVDMDDAQILSFGPHTADVLDALARTLYSPGAAG
ncbi:ABC transporter substrate-binding protein [Amycolatopsis sp. PS_44_ISF1]|uniref:heme/hemin ABC transporter substrate-binding protein n=1 Tax=Amycolatopsis sp. PS_44_ISF1 TaxID=2974917 RepID=UPI0028DFF75E|nr:ABC transporter substrate-binding protein [Amycolatopsis sp. PS_44_ISF1]MDT8913367.1 ABC transporter substrate-binding protein [Amycolatopsis sp. PS_44_ISF1]